MTPAEKVIFIRQKAKEHVPYNNEKILWSLHAVKKLRNESLRKKEVENALKSCEIIEDYQGEGRPLPDCLVLGFIGVVPLHIVTAVDMDTDRIIVVTVYKPHDARWKDGWRKRKN